MVGLALDDVVLVFACSDNFVPYLSVAVQSIIENASEAQCDVIVLVTSHPQSMITLTRQCQVTPNVGIGFLDVDAALGDIELPHHGHFRPGPGLSLWRHRFYQTLLRPSILILIWSSTTMLQNFLTLTLRDTPARPHAMPIPSGQITAAGIQPWSPYLKNELGMDDHMTFKRALS